MSYFNKTKAELVQQAAAGNAAATRELRRRREKNNPAAAQNSTGRQTVQAAQIPQKQQAGKLTAKLRRESEWSDKKRAFVERARKVMSRARDIMTDMGWFPAEAIKQAWVEEKTGALDNYVPRERQAAPEEVRTAVSARALRNNPRDRALYSVY